MTSNQFKNTVLWQTKIFDDLNLFCKIYEVLLTLFMELAYQKEIELFYCIAISEQW